MASAPLSRRPLTTQKELQLPSVPKTEPAQLQKIKATISEFQKQAEALKSHLSDPRALSHLSKETITLFEAPEVKLACTEHPGLRQNLASLLTQIDEVGKKEKLLDSSTTRAAREQKYPAAQWFSATTEGERIAKICQAIKKNEYWWAGNDITAGKAYVTAYFREEVTERAAVVERITTQYATIEERFVEAQEAYKTADKSQQPALKRSMAGLLTELETLKGKLQFAEERLHYAKGAMGSY